MCTLRMPGCRGKDLRRWFDDKVLPTFARRMLPFDLVAARILAASRVPEHAPYDASNHSVSAGSDPWTDRDAIHTATPLMRPCVASLRPTSGAARHHLLLDNSRPAVCTPPDQIRVLSVSRRGYLFT